MTEWTKGFLSGLIATIIGFILTMVWDLWKTYRDKRSKDKVVYKLILDVLKENKKVISDNNYILNEELQLLPQRQFALVPLYYLNNEFWEIIKFNVPKELLGTNDLLKKLQDISTLTKQVIANITNRESYKNSNGANSAIGGNLEKYDNLILQMNSALDEKIDNFLSET
jgi:hypothetical protein